MYIKKCIIGSMTCQNRYIQFYWFDILAIRFAEILRQQNNYDIIFGHKFQYTLVCIWVSYHKKKCIVYSL